MRALAVIAALASSGCSILFNPDNVKITMCDPLPPVAPFEVIAGDGTALTWQWPNAPAAAVGFREWVLCWGATAATTDTCRTFPFGACDGGVCSFTLSGPDAGLEYNKRVYGDLLARDRCGATSELATTSATPINGTFLDTQGITVTSPCDAGVKVLTPGELVFDEVANLSCISTAMMGDELWRDGTIDVDVRVFGDSLGGLGVRAPIAVTSATPRNGVLITSSQQPQASTYVTRRDPNGADVVVATASPVVRDAQWGTMRLSMLDRVISVEIGTSKSDLREVIRWRDPSPASQGQLGFALAAAGFGMIPGRVDVKNLRVRTGATIPDGGPARDSWSFAGLDALHAVRRVGGASLVGCPAYPAVAGCATCLPDAGSQCLEVMGNAQASIDVPIGIDFSRPWKVKFKLAADMNGNATAPQILRTTVVGPAPGVFDAFSGFALIDSTGFNWNQPLRAYQDNAQALGVLVPGTWNTFEMSFNPAASTYVVNRNGTLARSGGSPAALGAHLSALVLGGGGYHGWFTDLEISQEP